MDRDPFDFAPNELDADNEVERPKDGEDDPALMAPVLEALKTVRDPEIPVNLMPSEVEEAIRTVPAVTDVRVKLVWTPPWTQDLMSDEARLELGLL